MAALDFPASPANGQLFVAGNGVTYQYTAAKGLWLATTLSGVVATPTWDSRNDAVLGSTPIPQDDTIPQITEGNRLFQRTFTAVDPSHPIEVDADAEFGSGGAGVNCVLALFIDNGPDAVAVKINNLNVAQAMLGTRLRWRGVLSAGPHTFEVRWGHAGNIYLARTDGGRLYGGTLQATMSVSEIGVGPQGPQGPAGAPGVGAIYYGYAYKECTVRGVLASGVSTQSVAARTATQGAVLDSINFTPKRSDSILEIEADFKGTAAANDAYTLMIFNGSVFVDETQGYWTAGSIETNFHMKTLLPSPGTAPLTFNYRIGANSASGWAQGQTNTGSGWANNPNLRSWMSVKELLVG